MHPHRPPTRWRTCLSALPHPHLGPTFSIFAAPTLFSQRTDVLSPLPSPLGGRCWTPSPLHVSLHLLLRGCAHHLILCDSCGVRPRHGQSRACPSVVGQLWAGPPLSLKMEELLKVPRSPLSSPLVLSSNLHRAACVTPRGENKHVCSLAERPAPCLWGGRPACSPWPGCGFSTFHQRPHRLPLPSWPPSAPPDHPGLGGGFCSLCVPSTRGAARSAYRLGSPHLGWNWVFCKCGEES